MTKKFTFLILVSVIVLFGYLIVYPKFIKKTSSRYYKVINDIRYIGKVIDQYYEVNGKYPTTTQGLDVLTEKTGMDSSQYVNKIPVDSWGYQYHYLFPGTQNPDTYDLWSYGADNLPGGKDENSDIGNWMGLE
ncbi:MAG: type II secretion system protein GspG [Candidatus Thiodiazotropha endolucinida]